MTDGLKDTALISKVSRKLSTGRYKLTYYFKGITLIINFPKFSGAIMAVNKAWIMEWLKSGVNFQLPFPHKALGSIIDRPRLYTIYDV